MYYRFDLTDEQWERPQSFFPDRYHHGRAGHPGKDHRPLANAIPWHLHTGAPWPDTPERYGPWQTVCDRFSRWRKGGTWAKILDALPLPLGLVQGVPGLGDALRQVGRQLRRPRDRGQHPIPPSDVPRSPGCPIVRNDLVGFLLRHLNIHLHLLRAGIGRQETGICRKMDPARWK